MNGDRDIERTKETSEVFTPTPLVQEIIKKIPDEDFTNSTKTFLDPACGDGQFLGEILIKKLEAGIDFETALKTLYGADIMPDNVEFCQNHLLCGQEEYRHIVEKNIVCADALTYHFRFDETNDPWAELFETEIKMKKMKKPIDIQRDSAFSHTFTHEIKETIPVGDDYMLVFGPNEISRFQLADNRDPNRTDITIPNTSQQILSYGIDDEWVQRILFMAGILMLRNGEQISDKIDKVKAFNTIFRISEHIATWYNVKEKYLIEEKEQASEYEISRSVNIPAIKNFEGQCDQFIRGLNDTRKEVHNFIKDFYGFERFDKLKKSVQNLHFSTFIEDNIQFFETVKASRDGRDHKISNTVNLKNFDLDGKKLKYPEITVKSKSSGIKIEMPINEFFDVMSYNMINFIEHLIAFVCIEHTNSDRYYIAKIPEANRRQYKYMNYGYGLDIDPVGFFPIG